LRGSRHQTRPRGGIFASAGREHLPKGHSKISPIWLAEEPRRAVGRQAALASLPAIAFVSS